MFYWELVHWMRIIEAFTDLVFEKENTFNLSFKSLGSVSLFHLNIYLI